MSDDLGGGGTRPVLSLNGGGRKPEAKDKDLATRAQAKADAEAIAIKVCEYYMQQIPGLVTGMINGALVAYGLVELTPTKKPDTSAGGTSDPATTDPATGASSSEPTAQIPSADQGGEPSDATGTPE